MKLRRLLSCMMALLLVCSLPLAAFADAYDLANGSVSIEAKADGQYVTQGETSKNDNAPVITQSNNETATNNTVTITAAENTTANVTLDGVNIDTGTSGGAAIQTSGDGNVVIELDGTNTVQSGNQHAGVEKDNGGNLTITDGNETAGSLEATGGRFGAGIGGGYGDSGENITVTGNAQVTANGGTSAAGIGGGGGDSETVPGGSGKNITISGDAVVEANGSDGIPVAGQDYTCFGAGAGIGGGGSLKVSGDGTGITITGNAHVTANGGDSYYYRYGITESDGGGAGIGGGGGARFYGHDTVGGSGSGIQISGENTVVTATGGVKAAGIGGGDQGSGSRIEISGKNTVVNATGGDLGSGIGGGRGKDGSNITISGSAEVTAQGGAGGSGIGGGFYGSGSEITITGNANVDANGGSGGSGIGGGDGSGSGSVIIISGSAEVTAKGGLSGSGIGGGFKGLGAEITVSQDAQVKAQGGNSFNRYYDYYGAGAAIGNGGKSSSGSEAAPGEDVAPNTNDLNEGWIATYTPGTTDLDNTDPDTLTYQNGDGKIVTGTDVKLATDKEPTCSEMGHKGGFQVGDDLVGAEILNSPPHDLEHHDAKSPTCEEIGWDSYDTCKRDGCTYSTYAEKDVLGHSFTHYVSNNDATYAKDGTKTARCDHPGCDATDTITDPGTRLPAPAFQLKGQDGMAVGGKTEQKDGVLTITVDEDFASLTGYLGGLQSLQAQGIDTIVFVTNGATSTFALSDLMATMTAGDSYTLTHDGSTTTFTLGTGTNISSILK